MYPLHLPVQDKLLDRDPGAALGGYRGGRREAGLLAAACEAYAGQMGGSLDRSCSMRVSVSTAASFRLLISCARTCCPMLPVACS
jgi:hypothetical protein